MSIYLYAEDLHRDRMRQLTRVAGEQRLIGNYLAARRWHRLAAWACRRARHYDELT